MPPLVPPAVIYAGVASHIGLAIPKPFQTVWEQVTTNERRAHSIVEGNIWSKFGLLITKIIIWSCTLSDLAHITLSDAPHSPAGTTLATWLPSSVLQYLQSLHVEHTSFTITQYAGIAFLTAGVITHLSARLSLGGFSSYPLISANATPRMLYVPPSQISYESSPNDALVPVLNPPNPQAKWSLRISHRLVTTGPYAYVQHPMYLGALLTLIGSGLFYLSSGSILRVMLDGLSSPTLHSQQPTLTGITIALATALGCATVIGLVKRATWEEAALEERFGKEYAVYQWRVPYRLIPGLY